MFGRKDQYFFSPQKNSIFQIGTLESTRRAFSSHRESDNYKNYILLLNAFLRFTLTCHNVFRKFDRLLLATIRGRYLSSTDRSPIIVSGRNDKTIAIRTEITCGQTITYSKFRTPKRVCWVRYRVEFFLHDTPPLVRHTRADRP